MNTLDLFKDTTPEEVRILVASLNRGGAAASHENMSRSAKERWNKMSEEAKKVYLEKSFHSKESFRKIAETTRRIWRDKTPEEIEKHIRSSFLSPEAIAASGRGYSRFISRLSPEDRGVFNRDRLERIRAFWSSPRSGATSIRLSRKAKEAWSSKSSEEKARWLSLSCQNPIARRKAGPKISGSLRTFWESLSLEEKERRLYNSVWSEESRLNVLKALGRSPSEPERLLGSFLGTYYPGEWFYNGNGERSVVVGSRVPDFVRGDGLRWVLSEMGGFGWLHFWEDKEEEIRYYKEHGYFCTVIWEWDCYSWDELKVLLDNVKRTELSGEKYIGLRSSTEGGG